MGKLKVQVVNNSQFQLPEYASVGDAGLDLRANIEETLVLKPRERMLIPTGIHIQLPLGYEAQVRPRSGLALKYGVTVCNTPGTIDANFRGEIGVILINHGESNFIINPGDRIAQMVVAKHEIVEWEPVNHLDKTERGEGGFGHSGVK